MLTSISIVKFNRNFSYIFPGAEEESSVHPDDPENDPVFLEELNRLGKESGENTVCTIEY